MKDATATMGAILPNDVSGRDAVHVAVVSTEAAEDLKPGQDVGKDGTVKDPVGIVDPYIKGDIKKGERFWMFLYPRSITSLSHKWSHPSFEEDEGVYVTPAQRLESEKWLREFAEKHYVTYDKLIKMANIEDGERISFNDPNQKNADLWAYEDCYLYRSGDYVCTVGTDWKDANPYEIASHVESVTGKRIKFKPEYYACSC